MENVRTPQEGGGLTRTVYRKKCMTPSGGDDRQ